MKMLHKVWKKLIWVWNKCQGYEKSAWWYETNDKCSETNTHLKDAHIVLLTDFFRTVFVWCGFVSYHCQWQYTFLYETDPFVCFFVFVVYNKFEEHSTFFTTKMSQNLYCVPLVAHHEWESFVPLKLFLYQLVGQFCTFQDGICVVWVCFVCVCLLLQDLLQSCARGGGGEWRTCAMRYDEPRLVWTRLTTTH